MRASTFAAVLFIALGLFGAWRIVVYRSAAHASGAPTSEGADAGPRSE